MIKIVALSIPCMAPERSRRRPVCTGRRAAGARVSLVPRNLVIKVTAGQDEPERCNQAFTVAATAVASGVPVSLWLTGEAAWFALPGRAGGFTLPHAAPLPDLLESVLALGTVTVCSQCAARRDITPDDVIEGVRIAGSATFVAEVVADDAQALVY
jgi:predicted peroxiredoxin